MKTTHVIAATHVISAAHDSGTVWHVVSQPSSRSSLRGIALVFLFVLLVLSSNSWAQVSISSLGTPYTESFDGMGSSATATLPAGFKIGTDWSSGTTATTLAYGSTGAGAVAGNSTGGVINWANGVTASATDRSLGFLNTGSFTSPRSIVFAFVNDTGSTITGLTITFDYEQTRSGTRQFDWTFFHGTTSIPSTAASAGDQSYAAEANNTTVFNPPTTTSKSVTLTGLSIAPGATYYIGWTFTGLAGSTNGKGIGIDNFNLTASSCTAPTATVSGSATICNGSSTTVEAALTGTGPWDVTWSDGVTQSGVATSPATRSVSPSTSTTYTVTAVSDASGCTPGTFSGSAIVTVNQPVTPSVSVSANPGTTTCAGNQVIFTATPVNGGGSPSYVWKTNGVQDTSVSTSSATYTNSNLANGETIDCQMTSSLTCVTASTADALQLTITITSTVAPSVSVSASPATTICAGSQVIFSATPVNGGSSPVYVWKTNGVHDSSVPASSATYTNSGFANGDTVDCQLISNDPCASPTTADALQITMTVNAVFTPSVNVSADPGSSICSNSPVTFTATPVNGGTTPTFQWKTNGTSVTGATSLTFITSSLKDGDVVTVVMTPSSEICVSPASATSSDITMTVNPNPGSAIATVASVVQNSTGNSASVPDAGIGASYVWTISNGTITAGDGTATITYTAGGNLGTLTLGCTVTTGAGCSSIGNANIPVHAPVLAGWDTSTQPGGMNNFGVSPLAASVAHADLTIGGLARGSGVSTTGTGAARGWGGVDWESTSAADAVTANKFVTFTVAPLAGFKVSFNAISKFDYRRSSSGATSGTIQYQVGGADTFHDITTVSYASSLSSGAALGPIDLSSITALQDVAAGTVVTFRIVNFGGTSGSGTWYIFDVGDSPATDFEVSGYVACVAPTATLAGDSTICAGSSASITTTLTGVAPWTVTWSDGVTSNNVTSSPLVRSVSPGSTTAYTLASVSDSGSCGAGTVSGSATVTVQPLPVVSVNSATVCAGVSATLTATTDASNPAYLWSPGGATTASITVSPSSTTLYTVTVTDGTTTCANTGSGTVTVNPLPTVTIEPAATNAECGSTVVLTASPAGDGPLTYQWYDVQTNAIAGETNVTLTLTNLHGADAGNYTIVVIGPFCAGSAVASVTAVDTLAPVITLLGANPTTNECHIAYTDAGATGSDACVGSVNVSTNSNVDTNVPGLYTVTYTADDGNGNTNTVTRSVYVVDSLSPALAILGANPATNECHVAYADAGVAALDACAGFVVVLTNSTVDANTPGAYLVTYTSDDGNGNTNSVSRTVHVVDTLAPAITILGANPATNECHVVYVDPGATASDACAGSVSVSTNDSVDANVPGLYTVVYTADDGNGNTNTVTRTVYVTDTAGPAIAILGANPATNECHVPYVDAGATANDVCVGSVVLSTNSTVDANVPGVYVVTYTADDGNGNTNTVTRSVHVVDTAAPTLTILGSDPVTNECEVAYVDAGATASDSCAGDVAVSTNIIVNANTPGAYTIVYTADDGNGNTNTASRTVYVEDSAAPLITYYFTNLTLSVNGSCAALMPDVTGTNYILAEDACTSAVIITQSPTNNAVLALGTNEVVLTVADLAGNLAYSTNTIVVVDTTGPVITIIGDNPLTWECHTSFVDPGASATDNCSGVVAVVTNISVDANVPASYVIEYRATDSAGNSTTNTRIVNVADTIAPVLTVLGASPATNECHIAYTDAGATASDACVGSVNVSTNSNVDTNVPGLYTVTYTADDGNGNTNTVTRSVYVVDTLSPALAILGANPATNECHMPYVDAGVAALDACAGFVVVSTNSTVDADTPGVYLVTYTTDDGNGNTNSVSRTVYVVDTLAPTLTILGANPATNECHVVYMDAGATASDACAGSVGVSTNNPVDGNLPGVYTVVYTSDDGNGNTNTAVRTVYVVDTTPPLITQCATNRTMDVGVNCLVIVPDFTGELTTSDACSVVTVTQSPSPGTEVGVGQFVVSFTANDASSNSSGCSFLLNVTTPVSANTNISISEFMAKNTVTITDDFGTYSDWIEIRNAGNCPVNLEGWSLTDSAAALTKWQFPATNIGPGQFLVIWASDQDRRIPGEPLHTNFKLSDEGEYLALVQPDGVSVATHFSPAFPPQLTDVSYGLPTDRPTNTFLAFATPGLANSPATNFVPATTNVIISEFMAKQTTGPVDDFGDHSDWVEIYNGGCCPVNLNNWSLTDNAGNLTKWRFPATNIGPGEFMVVWASDRNRRIPGAPLHTNFKMSDEGEYLALVQPDGVTIATQFSPTFPPQFPDVSYGLPPGGTNNGYLASPTFGSTNSAGTNFLVADLEFSPGRGWYTNLILVSISTPTPGVTIYYTTNGTVPGPTNGFVYTSPLAISTTTPLRAGGYRTAYLPTIETHTYVFPRQVVLQTGAGFPTNWGFAQDYPELGPVPAYYACNSNVLNSPLWGKELAAPLGSLPTLSIAMNTDDMFGTNGIYSNPQMDGVEWERPCSAEYFQQGDGAAFHINCGIRIQGEGSRDPTVTPKHNLRLLFKRIYGEAPLAFDLYPGSPVQEFLTLTLHASFDDHWFGAAVARAQMTRDQWCADTQEETGGFGTHGVYAHVYINGLYWGIYNIGERPDADYAASYLGGSKSDYDSFNGDELKDGNTNALNAMLSLARAGVTNDVAWSNMCFYLNVPTFIDYLMINWYVINHDWLGGHNFWLEGSVSNGVPFHFISWDAETCFDIFRVISLHYPIIAQTENSDNPAGVLYAGLHSHPEFRRLFGDRAQRLLFNRGALTPQRCADRWMKRAWELDTAIIAESVRWGITNWWASDLWGSDWRLNTREDWIAEQNYLMTNWFPQRTDILIGQLRDVGLYPNLDAPVFSPHGGIIVESLPVVISPPAETTLYYTTNGADPRLPDGNISPDALTAVQAVTITITNNTLLRARAFATNSWSALVEATYVKSSEVELEMTGITRRWDGSVQLDSVAWPGAAYTLQACTNLAADWQPIATVVPFPDGTLTYVDTVATNHPVRFYKLTWP